MEGFNSTTDPLWVRSMNWELTNPATGDVLADSGIRVGGGTLERPAGAIEGIARQPSDPNYDHGAAVYVVTGTVVDSSDLPSVPVSRLGYRYTRVVLSVSALRIHAQVFGGAEELALGSVASVRGELSLIDNFEWDTFGLLDTRQTWLVEDVRDLDHGDYLMLIQLQD